MDKLGFKVGKSHYMGQTAHPIMPKFPPTGGYEAGTGKLFMGKKSTKLVSRYKSPEFKQEVIDKYNELTVRNFNGDIIATPSSRALSKALKLGDNFDFRRYFNLKDEGLIFTAGGRRGQGSYNA